jgi:hypothetical protein
MLNGDALGVALAAAMGVTEPTAVASWKQFGNALITYLKTNTVVAIPSVAGVTPGAGTSGPGVGTIQ